MSIHIVYCAEPKEKCGFPPIIKNGDLIDLPLTEYASGSSVEYSCSSFHFLNGSKRIYCFNGQWTTPPICFGKPDIHLLYIRAAE